MYSSDSQLDKSIAESLLFHWKAQRPIDFNVEGRVNVPEILKPSWPFPLKHHLCHNGNFWSSVLYPISSIV